MVFKDLHDLDPADLSKPVFTTVCLPIVLQSQWTFLSSSKNWRVLRVLAHAVPSVSLTVFIDCVLTSVILCLCYCFRDASSKPFIGNSTTTTCSILMFCFSTILLCSCYFLKFIYLFMCLSPVFPAFFHQNIKLYEGRDPCCHDHCYVRNSA